VCAPDGPRISAEAGDSVARRPAAGCSRRPKGQFAEPRHLVHASEHAPVGGLRSSTSSATRWRRCPKGALRVRASSISGRRIDRLSEVTRSHVRVKIEKSVPAWVTRSTCARRSRSGSHRSHLPTGAPSCERRFRLAADRREQPTVHEATSLPSPTSAITNLRHHRLHHQPPPPSPTPASITNPGLHHQPRLHHQPSSFAKRILEFTRSHSGSKLVGA